MHTGGPCIKRIFHAGVAGIEVEVADEDLWGFVHVQHRHSVNGRIHRIAGGGIEHVVGADYDYGIGVFEVIVYRIHFVELFVRNVGFSQQHVHVAGHTACNGMNRVANFGAVGFQLVGQLANQMLRLRQRHSVAGNDDD